MSALKQLLWGLLAILGAVVLAYVTGVINPHEKVNGLWLVVAAGASMCWPIGSMGGGWCDRFSF